MDPVAHTLAGAALAEVGLKRLSRYATPVLIIGANLPDIDAIATLWGGDTALYVRRGWSHGILAMLLLPLLLAGAVWAWHHWRGKRKVGMPPFRFGTIIVLSYLAVWSHPLLDWMNTYGVRLLMPFSDTWFYGDTLFIIDPWFWLLTAVGVVLATSTKSSAIAGWLVLGAATTLLVLSASVVTTPIKVLWVMGLISIVIIRRFKIPSQSAARFGLATATIYVGAVYGLARMAESAVAARFPEPFEAQANPSPGNPFSHRVVLVYDTYYRIVLEDGTHIELPRQEPDDIVRAALDNDSIKGFVNWMRYPYWQVQETPSAWVVTFWDLRYMYPGAPESGIGQVQVEVPKSQLN